MADEPERRLVGAIHAELERQEAEDHLMFVGPVATDGTCQLEGSFDLYLLARSILAEMVGCTCAHIHRDPTHRCRQHPDVRPKTREEQAAFANAWDAKVAEAKEES